MAKWFKYIVSPMGQGKDSESSVPTFAWLWRDAITQIEGDGASVYGLSNADLQTRIQPKFKAFFTNSRYENFAFQVRDAISELTSFLTDGNRTPKSLVTLGSIQQYQAWQLSTSTKSALDGWMEYMNGTWVSGSLNAVKPTNTISLAATTGGQLPSGTSSGNAPKFTYCWVYDSDTHCSLPATASSQVALSSVQSAYNATNFDTPPTGATKLRIFREAIPGNTGVFYYVKDIPCQAGVSVGTIKMTEADLSLRKFGPPSWMCCPILPEFAQLYAMCFASQPDFLEGLFKLALSGLLQPCNVCLGPVNGLLGYNNQTQSGLFGTNTTTTYVPGSIQTANDYILGLQGFIGATNGVRARTTSALDAPASLSTITYSYRDSTTHIGGSTGGTVAGPLTLGMNVGDTVSLGISAGQIVYAVQGIASITGMSSGSFVIEAIPQRSL